MNNWHTFPWSELSFNQQWQPPSINPFALPWEPFPQPPIPWYDGMGHQIPNRYGRHQAVAPYTLHIAHKSSGTIGRDRPTSIYLGIAQVYANNSRARAVRGPPSVVQQDATDPLDYEIPYVDPQRIFISQSILY